MFSFLRLLCWSVVMGAAGMDLCSTLGDLLCMGGVNVAYCPDTVLCMMLFSFAPDLVVLEFGTGGYRFSKGGYWVSTNYAD